MAQKKEKEGDSTNRNHLSSFTVLTLTLPPHPADSTHAVHYLYIRPDSPKNPTADTPRSLFVANIPIDASENSIRALFKQVGGARVSHVVFEAAEDKRAGPTVEGQTWGIENTVNGKKRKRRDAEVDELLTSEEYALPETWELSLKSSGSSAIVVFVDRATAETAMREARKLSKKGSHLKWAPTETLGVERYISHHNLTYPPKSTLQHSVNSFLAQYSAMEEARSDRLKQLRSEPDEEGFITVTRGGRNQPVKLETAQAIAQRAKERQEKKKVGSGFYRFQAREEAKRKERQLRDKFEEDARRVSEMRKRRGRIRPE